jgi:hypothetical protein
LEIHIGKKIERRIFLAVPLKYQCYYIITRKQHQKSMSTTQKTPTILLLEKYHDTHPNGEEYIPLDILMSAKDMLPDDMTKLMNLADSPISDCQGFQSFVKFVINELKSKRVGRKRVVREQVAHEVVKPRVTPNVTPNPIRVVNRRIDYYQTKLNAAQNDDEFRFYTALVQEEKTNLKELKGV